MVRKGDVLFEINPRPFQAVLDQAKGQPAQAEAQLGKAKLDVERDTPLAKARAILQRQLDDDIQVSEQEYLDFNRRFPSDASREAEEERLQLELSLADGTTYPQKGKFYFADRQVNQGTGTFGSPGSLPTRAIFCAPDSMAASVRRPALPRAPCWSRSGQ